MPPKGTKHVTYPWTPEAERLVLLTALKRADFQPSRAFFAEVVETLPGSVTVEAVRYPLPEPNPMDLIHCFLAVRTLHV
jgi:hypothetical protein